MRSVFAGSAQAERAIPRLGGRLIRSFVSASFDRVDLGRDEVYFCIRFVKAWQPLCCKNDSAANRTDR